MPEALVACMTCGLVHSAPAALAGDERAFCARCGARLGLTRKASLHRTLAFTTAALLLYWPANVFPIMRLSMYGAPSQTTVWQGVVKLYEGGDAVIALIVFLASIAVPLLKLLGLFTLSVSAWVRWPRLRRARARIYRFIDAIGRWAMLDVFVLGMLVSLFKLKRLASVVPGSGALAFVGVVVLTLLASRSFDPRLIWEDA